MLSRPGRALPMDSWVLRPMINGWPMVSRLKNARSAGRRHGSPLVWPMTPLRATATTKDRIMRASHRDRRADRRLGIVALEGEVLVAEREQILHRGVEAHDGQRAGRAGELQPGLLEVV